MIADWKKAALVKAAAKIAAEERATAQRAAEDAIKKTAAYKAAADKAAEEVNSEEGDTTPKQCPLIVRSQGKASLWDSEENKYQVGPPSQASKSSIQVGPPSPASKFKPPSKTSSTNVSSTNDIMARVGEEPQLQPPSCERPQEGLADGLPPQEQP